MSRRNEARVYLYCDDKGFHTGMRRATWETANFVQRMRILGGQMQRAGTAMTRGVTLPILALGALSFKVSAEYESSMNQVQAASGATEQEMKTLGKAAMTMGNNIGFGARESAQAMLELAKSGMTPTQIAAGGLEASLLLAAAGGVALEDAATTTSNALNAFQLEAKQAGSVADALAGGANASSASVESLQQALAQASAGAVNAGLTLQETVGVLAAFADNGIQGSDAGTSLKTMLTRLVPTAKLAKDAMKKYNLSFVDSKGNIDDITTVAEKLQDRLGGLTEEQRAQALATIFGSDATRAATVLMREGAKGLQQYIDATKDREAAEKMAEAATKGGAGAVKKMKADLENAGIVAAKSFAPAVSKIADLISRLAQKFAGLSKKQQDLIVKLGLIAAACGPAIYMLGKTMTAVSSLAQVAKIAGGKGGGLMIAVTTITAISTACAIALQKLLELRAELERDPKAPQSKASDLAFMTKYVGQGLEKAVQAIGKGKNVRQARETITGYVSTLKSLRQEAVKLGDKGLTKRIDDMLERFSVFALKLPKSVRTLLAVPKGKLTVAEIDVKREKAKEKVRDIKAELKALGKLDPKPEVKVAIENAKKRLKATQREITLLDRMKAEVQVEVQDASAKAREVRDAIARIFLSPITALVKVLASGGVPPKAEGGPVAAGMSYLVGERGPELFTPSASGMIVPNDKLVGVGGDVFNIGLTLPQGVIVSDVESFGRRLTPYVTRGIELAKRRKTYGSAGF